MKLTREQYNKWSAALAEGWKFDAQHFITWGEKQIFTDSEPDERGVFYRLTLEYYAERIGRGYMAQKTGKQTPTLVIDRWTPGNVEGVYSSVQILKEAAAEPESKKNYNVLARLSASLDVVEYFKRAAKQDTGSAFIKRVTNDASAATDGDEDAQNKPTSEAAPDMFATLAAAYISGKTIKREPKHDEPPTVDKLETEAEPEAPQEPPRPGYHEASDYFTDEEKTSLSAGVPVPRKERYNSAAYITAPYSDGARLIYSISSYDERDRVNPGKDAKFWGVLIDGAVYDANSKAISAKFTEDINRFLLDYVKSEEDAAHAAANVDEYQRGRINDAKERDYSSEARRAFFDHKPPVLTLYYRDSSYTYEWDELINYLQAPEKVIEAAALRYLCESPDEVYISYIHYSRLSALYEAIKSDTGNEEHRLLKISDCITGQKSVRVELTNGHEVKVEADAVKYIAYRGHISSYDVSACDRQYLNKDQYGRDDDIKATDIVTISHGGRVLYRAS